MVKLAQMVLKEQSGLKAPSAHFLSSSYQDMSNSLSLRLKCTIYLNNHLLQVSVDCVIGMSEFTFWN